MKLYYAPAACSLAAAHRARELGLAYDIVRVDLRTHKLANGTDYYTINPKGYVPVLELDNGERLTEGRGDPSVHRRIASRVCCPGVRDDGALSAQRMAALHQH
jgi:glutathione S-transferase